MATLSPENAAVFMLDCDNTLLDNDAVKADTDARLRSLLGADLTARFWVVYEEVRARTQTVDYPLALEAFAGEVGDADLMARVRAAVMEYPFAQRLYPGALDALAHLSSIGLPTIISDGDTVYQPMKIEQSGLAAAVGGRVLIYVHKEDHLDEIMRQWPSALYVVVDDKLRILSTIKATLPDRFVTVHVRQGHYGADPEAYDPGPDLTVDHIAQLQGLTLEDFQRHLGST
jgi:FMN phosphatase YigB (HAD superfamily)